MPAETRKLNIPVIDMSSILLPDSNPNTVKSTVTGIGKALRDWGFFYIIGHQVDGETVEEFQRVGREFFSKPKEFKRPIARTPENFRGYSDAEFTARQLDWKEMFDFGWELTRKGDSVLGFDGENRWPEGMPHFKTTVLNYFDVMYSLSERLMSAIFASLGVDPELHRSDFDGSRFTSVMRMNHYPPCPDPDAHYGIGPHADPSALTILWQSMSTTCLQVERDGKFYDVYPLQDSFVVNIGEMVQVWSNGLYKAPVHRVLADHENPRYSSPFFYMPAYTCDVTPVETCISETNPCHYRPVNYGEFRSRRFQGDYADVGEEIRSKHYLIST